MAVNKQKLAKLKHDMDSAYNKKQQVWQDKQNVYEKVISLVDAYNDRLWHSYKIACMSIKIHKKHADEKYAEMVECFEASQEAFSEGDGALAKALSEEGHEHEEKLHMFNKAVQDCCKRRDEAKEFAKEHELSNDIKKLLGLDLAIVAKSNPPGDILEALKIAKQLRDSFELLHKDFKQKQTLYKNYKQYGESVTPLKNGTYDGTFDGAPAIIKVSDAGNSNQVQIFYGGKGVPDGPGHNHINITKDKLQFWRENGITIYQDDKEEQINNL